MRKLARTLVPALLAVALTAGCGGGGDSGTTTTTSSGDSPSSEASGEVPARGDADLVIWTDALKINAVKKVADEFAAAQGIKVATQAISSDLQTNFVTANSAGNGPDVVVGAHDWIGNLVQNGAIDPLPLSPDQLQGYSEKAVQATTYNDQLYGVPYGIEALGLYRNTDVAPDEPATLDDAIKAGNAAVKAGKVDSAMNLPVGENGDAYHMEPVLTSMGGYLFGQSPDGEYDPSDLGVGKPGSIAAAKEISALGKQKVLRTSISPDNSIALFTSGKAAFLVSGPWALPDVKKSGIKYAVQPVPGFAGKQPAEPFMGAQAFMVASNAKNKPFAQEFVTNGVNNEATMMALYEGTNLPPAMTAVQDKVTDKDIALFADAANKAQPMPSIPEMAAIWEPLGKAYAAIVTGADPTKTMKDAGNTISDAIKGG
jgi:arabinogalactan oligomer/maltooligosaccharide transport system substrate-binding protein